MKIEKSKNGKYIVNKEIINFIKYHYYDLRESQTTIGEKLGCNYNTIYRIMKNNNLKCRNNREQALKYDFDENYFEIIDSEHKAYWLGFMYADGYIMNKRKNSSYKFGLSLTEGDKEILEKFNNDLKSNYPIKTYESKTRYKNSKPYCRLLLSSNKACEDLIDKGCVVQKTDILKFPTEEQVPKHLIRHFIRGYLDGDGTIYISHLKNGYTTPTIGFCGTKNVLEGIQKELNCSNKIGKRWKDRNNDNWDFKIGGKKKVIEKLNWLYKDSTIFLQRKYNKYLEILKIYNK